MLSATGRLAGARRICSMTTASLLLLAPLLALVTPAHADSASAESTRVTANHFRGSAKRIKVRKTSSRDRTAAVETRLGNREARTAAVRPSRQAAESGKRASPRPGTSSMVRAGAKNAKLNMFIPECFGVQNRFLCASPPEPSVASPRRQPRRAAASSPAAPVAPLTYADVVASVRQVNVSLYLPDPVLRLGPDPAANEWDMAVVGHPLWLTTDSPDTVTASATHDELTFTFVAQRARTTFAMGDGHTVTCTTTTPYPAGVEPGTPSPTCGYTYQTPSLPRADYTVTVTSHWTVHWSVLNFTGQLPAATQGTATVPVGELQSVLRS